MTVQEFLFQAIQALRDGDHLDPSTTLPKLLEAKDQLEQWAEELEELPTLKGLEPLDEARFEVLELFNEALDLLELAVSEDIPELSELIANKTQDGIDVLRFCRQQIESQAEILEEEYGLKG